MIVGNRRTGGESCTTPIASARRTPAVHGSRSSETRPHEENTMTITLGDTAATSAYIDDEIEDEVDGVTRNVREGNDGKYTVHVTKPPLDGCPLPRHRLPSRARTARCSRCSTRFGDPLPPGEERHKRSPTAVEHAGYGDVHLLRRHRQLRAELDTRRRRAVRAGARLPRRGGWHGHAQRLRPRHRGDG